MTVDQALERGLLAKLTAAPLSEEERALLEKLTAAVLCKEERTRTVICHSPGTGETYTAVLCERTGEVKVWGPRPAGGGGAEVTVRTVPDDTEW
ncbi:MAG TPA: hypothetical protein VK689_15800 [Armatimonadota bacterium]|nr:hypothetical protein [Armatimonadota bacterium]